MGTAPSGWAAPPGNLSGYYGVSQGLAFCYLDAANPNTNYNNLFDLGYSGSGANPLYVPGRDALLAFNLNAGGRIHALLCPTLWLICVNAPAGSTLTATLIMAPFNTATATWNNIAALPTLPLTTVGLTGAGNWVQVPAAGLPISAPLVLAAPCYGIRLTCTPGAPNDLWRYGAVPVPNPGVDWGVAFRY